MKEQNRIRRFLRIFRVRFTSRAKSLLAIKLLLLSCGIQNTESEGIEALAILMPNVKAGPAIGLRAGEDPLQGTVELITVKQIGSNALVQADRPHGIERLSGWFGTE